MKTCFSLVTALLLAAPAVAQPTPDSMLQIRVTIEHRMVPAANVLKALAGAGGLELVMPSTELLPVTVTLTNARLRTALDAVCDNAGCQWEVLEGKRLQITGGRRPRGEGLPDTIDILINDVPVENVLRTIAASLRISLTLNGTMRRALVSVDFKEAKTSAVLDALCAQVDCTWRFDAARQTLIVTAK